MKKTNKLHFRRIELKYILPTKEADLIIPTISSYLELDPHSNKNGFYPINSVYFDSPNLICYQQKLDGIRSRKKYRLRYYDNSKKNFFEIKRKIGDTVIKDRSLTNIELSDIGILDIKNIINTMPISNFKAELLFDTHRFKLIPTTLVSYKRAAFVSRYSSNLRVTIDHDLQASEITVNSHNDNGRTFITPEYSVLEIKFNGSLPAWLNSVIKSHNLQRTSFSKYANAIEKVKIERYNHL